MTTDAIAVDETRDRAARPAGRLLLAGSPLFAAGVAGEWVLDPQLANGDVTRPAVFALCVGTSLVGAALLLGGVSRMTRVLPEGRAARWGGRITLAGAVLLALAVATVLVTGLATGTPHPGSFVPYGLGVLALAVGPTVLAVALRRVRPSLAGLLGAAGLGAFASVAVPADPWHDVSLMVMLGAWTAAGTLLRRG
jgi:hypothetical protein